MDALDEWIDRRAAAAERSIRRAVSATELVHVRAELGRTVRPAPGSVLASTRPGRWDPEPDYVFHWARDAAVAMRLAPTLTRLGEAEAWRRRFADYVAFSLAATDPERRPLLENPVKHTVRPEAARFVRPDAELRALTGDALLGEPRVEADGSPDLENWNWPQYDGPALRAASCLAVLAEAPELGGAELERLVARDLAFTRRHAGLACIGPWEEAPPRCDVFTLIAQWDALDRGADWLASRNAPEEAGTRAAAARLVALIAEAWDPAENAYRAALGSGAGEIDAAVALAIAWAGRGEGPFALSSPRALGTVAALERRFAALYPVNFGADPPLIGRSARDVYFGGNPWWPTTLAVAEIHFALAAEAAERGPLEPAPESAGFFARFGGRAEAEALLSRGDAYLDRLRSVAPEGDALPEQLDRETGAPVSCLDLTWSAAALLAAVEARRRALQAVASR